MLVDSLISLSSESQRYQHAVNILNDVGRSRRSHAAACFHSPHSVNMNKYVVVPAHVVFDTVVVVEWNMSDVYTILEGHRGGEFSDRAIDTFVENHFLQLRSDNSNLIVIFAVTVTCIGVFRI